MTDQLTAALNPQQREAVTLGNGPALILAGPGSGKTRVLTHRIAYLIGELGIHPYHIVAVTFTNKAAAEMRERVEKLLDGSVGGMQIGTFHSICARLLRVEGDSTPYGRDYVIFDTDDQLSLLKTILNEMNIDTKKYPPGRVLSAISAAKNELITPEDFSRRRGDYFTEIISRVYPIYQRRLVASNALDFDDLLMQTVLLLRENEVVREKYERRFEHVLVDEFQDTNQAQYQLVRWFAAPQNNLFVVGDEDQGIYAFRGADYRNVMNFRTDYPDARVVLLEQNYRSTQIVLDAARAIIDKNKQRTPKALFTDRQGGAPVMITEAYDENEEGETIARQINRLLREHNYTYRDFAIMYRTNAQSRTLEEACRKFGIPYVLVGGVAFYKRREIRDLVAYLRLIFNHNDETAFTRIVNVPARGIGEKSVETFLRWCHDLEMSVGMGLLALANGNTSPLTGRASKALTEFAVLLQDWRQLASAGDLLALFDDLTARIGYSLYLKGISDTTDQEQERLENVGSLRGLISDKRDLALGDVLEEIALVADVDSLTGEQDAVTLLTMHAAKGLEFSVVFLTGVEDGILPHSRSFDNADEMSEERRLLYVALTRAKDQLFLTYTFRRALYGEAQRSLPSRFLGDLPPELLAGAPVRVKQLQERAGYQRATKWDDDFKTPSRSPDAPAPREERFTLDGEKPSSVRGVFASKVIPFDRAARELRSGGVGLKFRAGMRVQHPKWGEGVVQSSRASGTDEEVTVRFSGVGTKIVLTSMVEMRIVSG